MKRASETIHRKKEHAMMLYTIEGVTVQSELAERAGVSKQTINKWVNSEGWEKLRSSVILTKESELRRLYMQLTELNDMIMKRETGFRFANSKEADVLIKLTAAIRQLETDTSIADVIEVMKKFIHHVRNINYLQAKEITALADDYIKSIIK